MVKSRLLAPRSIDYCLFHTGDDAVAVKTSQKGDKPTADCSDITVRDLLAINNSATAKIGTETMGGRMERIHFERVCAVRTVRLVALDVYDVAQIGDISWIDCHAHQIIDEDGISEPFVVDLYAPPDGESFRSHAAQARAQGIQLKRISSNTPAPLRLYAHNSAGHRR